MKRITIECKDDPRMCKRMVVTDVGYFCEVTRCGCFSQYIIDTTEKSAKQCRSNQPAVGKFPYMNMDRCKGGS